MLVDKLDRQVKKHKEKLTDHHAKEVEKRASADRLGARAGERGDRSERQLVRLVIISGVSGSGKSVALHVLEDLGFYCIDNIPVALLRSFVDEIVPRNDPAFENVGVGLDARNRAERHRRRSRRSCSKLRADGVVVRGHLPADRRQGAAVALQRDAPQAPADGQGHEPRGSHREGARAARPRHQHGRARDRHDET